jgi:hypothetical protein
MMSVVSQEYQRMEGTVIMPKSVENRGIIIIKHSMDNPLINSTNLKSIPPSMR